jgi:hypothetical protein
MSEQRFDVITAFVEARRNSTGFQIADVFS